MHIRNVVGEKSGVVAEKTTSPEDKVVEICKECGEEFIYTVGEESWLKEHKLAPFKRCPFCRRKRRHAAAVAAKTTPEVIA